MMDDISADRKALEDFLGNIPQVSTLQGLQNTPSHTPQATPPGTPPVHSKKYHKGKTPVLSITAVIYFLG